MQRDIEEVKNPDSNRVRNFQDIYLELLVYQRQLLNKMNRLSKFDEQLIRKYLSLVDIEKFKLREKLSVYLF